jgi:hypothetical protein
VLTVFTPQPGSPEADAIRLLAAFEPHVPHRSLQQQPPTSPTPPRSCAAVRPLRRDRLGGLIHEYVHVA